MTTPVSTLKLLRQTHLYIGVFIAPTLLFFALSGALQTFSLHESKQGSTYKPPSWIVTLAQIHKNQTDVLPRKRPSGPPPAASDSGPTRPDKPGHAIKAFAAAPAPSLAPASPSPPPVKAHNSFPLKIFFLLVAIGLFTSTLTGLYMAYKYNRNKFVVTALLLAGAAIPLLLLKL